MADSTLPLTDPKAWEWEDIGNEEEEWWRPPYKIVMNAFEEYMLFVPGTWDHPEDDVYSLKDLTHAMRAAHEHYVEYATLDTCDWCEQEIGLFVEQVIEDKKHYHKRCIYYRSLQGKFWDA